MKHNLFLAFSACAVASATAFADVAPVVNSRTAHNTVSIAKMAKSSLGASTQDAPVIVVATVNKTKAHRAAGEYTPAPEIDLLNESFSSELLSSGEVGDPDLYTNLIDPNYEKFEHPAWYNLKPAAFDGVIWGGHNMYPAGGSACLFNKAAYEVYEANITVPLVDASAEGYEGIVNIEFKARVEEGKKDSQLLVEAAETYDMAPSWKILGSGVATVTEDWQTFTASFYGGEKSVILNLANFSGTSIYIDDIRVYQVGQPAQTPVALPYSDYKGTSWTANWEAGAGAESYLLDVYSVDKEYDPQTGQVISETVTYLLKDQAVNDTHYDVTNSVSGQKYYYCVRSVKGDFVSLSSNVITVNELLPTTMHKVTDLKGRTFTASWDAIPGAEVYNYWVRFNRTAKEDGVFTVTDEAFTGVVDHQGFPTYATKEDPEQFSYSTIYYTGRKQPGWRGLNSYPYTDYIAVDVWQYIFNSTDAGYVSPEFNMAKDNGKFTVTVDLAANEYVGDDGTGKTVRGYPKGALAVFNYDEEQGDYVQSELYYAPTLSLDWKTCKFNCTSGSERTVIGIYGTWAPENMYIDNLKVEQNYKAGENLIDPCCFNRFHEGTEVTVKIPEHAVNTTIYHQVCGLRAEIVEESLMGEIAFLESPYTPLEKVEGTGEYDWSGVKAPSLARATVQLVGDCKVMIQNPEHKTVVISDAAGRTVYTSANGNETQYATLPGNGLYLIKVGTQTVKLGF